MNVSLRTSEPTKILVCIFTFILFFLGGSLFIIMLSACHIVIVPKYASTIIWSQNNWSTLKKMKVDHQPWVCVKLGNGFEWKLCRAPTRWPTNHINGHYWPTARKQSQGSFSIQVTTFWSKICFWCQDSPHSDVYFATNSFSQKKNCCVRCELNYIYYTTTNTPKCKKFAFYVGENTQIYSEASIGL